MPKLKEEWKQIVGMHYLISNKGRCKNTKTKRLVHPVKNNTGYYQYILTEKGKYTHFLVHKLVAEYFLKQDKAKPYVRFKEKNKVKWCRYNIERTSYPTNSKAISAYKNGKKVADFGSAREASEYIGRNYQSISKCLNGRGVTCGGYTWEYSK